MAGAAILGVQFAFGGGLGGLSTLAAVLAVIWLGLLLMLRRFYRGLLHTAIAIRTLGPPTRVNNLLGLQS